MATRSIRGATTVENNDKKEILRATSELLEKILYDNHLKKGNIISIFFTATKDLTKAYPAEAAREMGITKAGLMCFQELFVEGSLEKCIRVLVLVESNKDQDEMSHIYLKKAENLRKDLVTPMPRKYYSIAIDGPNGAGKSTIARTVAKEMGFIYIDTGAMYRATGYYCIKKGIGLDDHKSIKNALNDITINISYFEGSQRIFLNGKDVSEVIRSQEGADGASKVAIISEVREKLVSMQQQLAKSNNIVMDGRDIGTKVLPNADLKIYLDASIDIRTKRRFEELKQLDIETNFENVKREIEERDKRDMTRDVSPLRKADDAVVLDTSEMDIKAVSKKIIGLFNEIRGN